MENSKITLIPKTCFGPCHTFIMKTSIFAESFVTDEFDKVLNTPLLIYDMQPYINLAINIRNILLWTYILLWIYFCEHPCYTYCYNEVSVACRKPHLVTSVTILIGFFQCRIRLRWFFNSWIELSNIAALLYFSAKSLTV